MPDVSCHGGGVDDDIDPGNSSKSQEPLVAVSEREIMFEINVQVAAVALSVSLHNRGT